MAETPEESSIQLSGASETDELETFQRTRPHRGSEDADRFLRAVVKMGASDLHSREPDRSANEHSGGKQ
jgi:hypothetical protein